VAYPAGWTDLHDSTGWELVDRNGRVTSYTKSLPVSPVPAIRVELETRAAPERLLEHVWAVDRYPETLPSAHITAAGILERRGSRQRAWQVVDAPFLTPRLYVYDHYFQDSRIFWIGVPDASPVPGQEATLIPPVSFGSWEVVPEEDHHRLIYRACTDPGGRVPAWIVAQANRQALPRMLLELEQAALRCKSHK
jgi:hypothetical protein